MIEGHAGVVSHGLLDFDYLWALYNPRSMRQLLRSVRRIKFSDCDPMGHLYNGRYIQLLLDAREDQVEDAYGLNPIDHMKQTGKGWVVAQNQINYLRSAVFNEATICRSLLRDYDDRRMEVECTMYDRDERRCKAVLWTTFYYLDVKTHRTTPHDDWLMRIFEEVRVHLDETRFEERVLTLRKLNRAADRQVRYD